MNYSAEELIKLISDRVRCCAKFDLNTCKCVKCPLHDNFGDMKDLCMLVAHFDTKKES